MAILSASAKLYTGIRCWCVDKNISANLTASFSLGNRNRPASGGDTVFANVLAFKLRRAIADLVVTPSVSLTNERLKTFGGGNNVITPGASRVIDNTNNWRVTASVVCKFPTYFRIDVDKLQLPQGTTCTVSFEEDWIRDGVYLESTKASSPAVGNFFTFRTPWQGASFINSAFTLPNRTGLRIKQLTSAMSSPASLVAYPIFNPGKLAALFGGVFFTLPTARKTAVGVSSMVSSFASNTINLKIKQLASIFVTDVATLTSDSEVFNTPGPVTMTTSFTMTVDAVKNTEINLVSSGFASMTTMAVKTARINSAMVLGNSLSAQANYRIDSLIPTLAATSSVELVTDIRFIMQTNLNAVDYLGNTLTNTLTVGIPLGGLHNANTNITIFWGDGSSDTYANSSSVSALSSTNPQHTYAQHGEYDIRIKVNAGSLRGINPGINFPDTNWTNKIKHFVSFGYKNFSATTTDLSMQRLFARVPYAQFKLPNELPIHTGTKDADWRFEQLFQDSKVNPAEIANWQIYGRFASLQSMFQRATNFNQPFNNDFVSNLTTGVNNWGNFITDASQFNNPLTFWEFPNSQYNSGDQFGLVLNGTAMNSENWNRTLIALANALTLNTQSGFIATITRPSGATTNSTVYGSGTYSTGTGARTYLISRGWTVG